MLKRTATQRRCYHADGFPGARGRSTRRSIAYWSRWRRTGPLQCLGSAP